MNEIQTYENEKKNRAQGLCIDQTLLNEAYSNGLCKSMCNNRST